MRGDVRTASRVSVPFECPDCGSTDHGRYGEYPAISLTGAWGKYLNPVYCCLDCHRTHTLKVYESDRDQVVPDWGPYPPNQAEDRHLTIREKREKYASAGGDD